MKEEEKNKIINHMNQIGKLVDSGLHADSQKRENTMYFKDFEFGNSGLAIKNVYIVEIKQKIQEKTADNPEKNADKKEKEDNLTTYEIFDDNDKLIAMVSSERKVQFVPEYLEQLKENYGEYFKQLELDDIDFELPKELKENDIVMTKAELDEREKNGLERNKEGKKEQKQEGDSEKEKEEEEEEKEPDQETEEEKREKTAKALNIDKDEIKAVSTINPSEKITDKYNLVDLMPEASKYASVSIVCSTPNEKSNGQFTILGVKQDGTREPISSIEPVEGTTGNKNVISINEDGSKVEEKQVKGLLRINARNRDDGIAVSIGDYGMLNVDYVSNIMDKENRRSTPIRTMESENQRIPSAKVKENAGDSKEEVKQEGRIYRQKEEDGMDPQTLDGIDTDQMDGKMTLEELKKQILDKALEEGDMSRNEQKEFIEAEINKSGLELSEDEKQKTVEEINTEIVDESRFPDRNIRQ